MCVCTSICVSVCVYYPLTDEDEARGLEESLIVPIRMLLVQHVTDAVVLAQPDGGVHKEAGHQAERLVAHGEALRLGHVRRVHHLHAHIAGQRRVHLAIHHLSQSRERKRTWYMVNGLQSTEYKYQCSYTVILKELNNIWSHSIEVFS